MMNYQKYRRNPVIDYPERQWPGKEIEKAPIWCSVDLRDGNQALVDPMVVEEKIEMFQYLIKLGFKEIEVGFPAASQIEFDFLRHLIEHDMIPDDVYVQVLTQCREELIARTFESIQGCKQAIVHIYNSTSTLQRDVVFHMDRPHIVDIAVKGTELVKKYAADFPGKIVLEYSPESFTGTELDFALEICTAVQKTWGATKENPIIINLPSTVEMNTPNVYADQIEWMNRHFENRESIILSIHPHNDRGTGVASAELALLAGAERVEGTLFGNGERTGNVDVLNIAYNMFSQGINPELEIGHVNDIIGIYERCCKIPIHPRHPYAGKLVFTAFSGSHQDAINKGVQAMKERKSEIWQVRYRKGVRTHRAYQFPVRQGRCRFRYGYLFRLQAAQGDAQRVCKCYPEDIREAGRGFPAADHGQFQARVSGSEGTSALQEAENRGSERRCGIRRIRYKGYRGLHAGRQARYIRCSRQRPDRCGQERTAGYLRHEYQSA